MKNIVRVLLYFALALSMGFALPAGFQIASASEEPQISVRLNGQALVFDQSPIIENNRTLVPMRVIFESLGASVSWIEESQTIIAQKGDTFFNLQIGNNTAFVDGEAVILDTAPKIVNDRTLVPVRFIAESLGAKVDWDEVSRSVIIVEESRRTPMVQIKMGDGKNIVLELYPQYAPKTVANFLELVGQGFYNGLTIHRVIPGFMIQGGDPKGDGTGGSSKFVEGEFAENGFTQNMLSHTRGVISMARAADPNSATSQFFIVQGDASYLDDAYAAFGKVVSGMEVVDEIVNVPVLEGGEGSTPVNKPVIKKMTVLLEEGIFMGEVMPGADQEPELSLGQQIKAIRTDPDAEKVVMTINGAPVTKKQLETYRVNYSSIGLSEQELEDNFILEKLLSMQAVPEGCTVSEKEIDEVIASAKTILEVDTEFITFLKDAEMTEDEYWQETRESIKDSLLISKLFEKFWDDYQKANSSLSEMELYDGYMAYYEVYTEDLKAEAKIVYMK